MRKEQLISQVESRAVSQFLKLQLPNYQIAVLYFSGALSSYLQLLRGGPVWGCCDFLVGDSNTSTNCGRSAIMQIGRNCTVTNYGDNNIIFQLCDCCELTVHGNNKLVIQTGKDQLIVIDL